MTSLAVASTAFACIFGSSVFAMRVRRYLPEAHFSPESKDVVKLGMG